MGIVFYSMPSPIVLATSSEHPLLLLHLKIGTYYSLYSTANQSYDLILPLYNTSFSPVYVLALCPGHYDNKFQGLFEYQRPLVLPLYGTEM